MRKKFLGLLVTAIMMSATTGLAQQVTVTGVGMDRESAKRDAMRNAVEQVIGTYVNSETMVKESRLIQDEIYSKTNGFVTDVNVLKEELLNGTCTVEALINVNTNPNSQLVNTMELIRRMNNPRIGVIVFKKKVDADGNYYSNDVDYDTITEGEINNKLLDMGFDYVTDVSLTSKLRNASLLKSIYNGNKTYFGDNSENGIDVLILCNSDVEATKISIGNQYGDRTTTGMLRGSANLTGKVIIFSTGTLRGSFAVDGQGVDISAMTAQNRALKDASTRGANEVEKIIRRSAAKVFDGVKVTVRVKDDVSLQELTNDIKGVYGVQNVQVREYSNGQAVLDVETTQKTHNLLQMLKAKSKLRIFGDGITANSINLVIS